MDFNDITIEEVKAALAHIRETPVPEGKNPFWYDRAEQYLWGLLERLKAKA